MGAELDSAVIVTHLAQHFSRSLESATYIEPVYSYLPSRWPIADLDATSSGSYLAHHLGRRRRGDRGRGRGRGSERSEAVFLNAFPSISLAFPGSDLVSFVLSWEFGVKGGESEAFFGKK